MTADPCDVKSEEALLGAILVSPGTVTKARIEVTAEDFYRETHGLVWDAAVRCSGNGGCDPVSVAAELKRRGVEARGHNLDGLDYLQYLAQSVPAPGNAKAYAERVKETAEYRKLRRFAQSVIDGVDRENKDSIAKALDSLGQRVLYIDVSSGEVVETCPTCLEKEAIEKKQDHRIRSLLAQVSQLEGKAEKEARQHKLWGEIEACFQIYKVVTGHYGIKFTTTEFQQALPRWKEESKGRKNPCKGALRAICGVGYDPTTTKGKNGKPRAYQDWELLTRSQFKWSDFKSRTPGVPSHENDCTCRDCENTWWRCLWSMVGDNLK